ncbi:mitochondrial import inner membrane translocase subunit Tim29-like [Uloborus diversus]|uniref:mitochondrial import inner membrane translocase subunit Tim29-like n=1 Tax=Uloborus diversus TaxID=327109 RepID=UPI002409E5B6|nr:mitochondrial import inner membrane translocase subunit Tim29-like [Uloborus diversus]
MNFLRIRAIAKFGEIVSKRFSLLQEKLKLPEKWKGGRVEQWSLFWQGMFLDYKTVATDVIQGAKNRPHKAVLVASGLGVLFTALKTNPDEQSFYDQILNCVCILAMVGDPIRNPKSEEHINYLVRYQNQSLLRRTDLLFFNLIWVADYPKNCGIYAAHCKYLKPHYLTFYQRIIDVGIFGTWWNMKLKMRDFDVNPSEWVDKT